MATLRAHAIAVGPVPAPAASKLRAHGVVATSAPLPTGKLRAHSVGATSVVLTSQALLRLHAVQVRVVESNRAPVVSIDKTALVVDSGEDFVLTGYDSDPDGVIASRTWRRAGTAVTVNPILQQRAPVVTADTVITYTYSAVDDDGDTTTATALVTVLRAPIVVRLADGTLSGRVFRTFTAAEVAAANAAPPAGTVVPGSTGYGASYGTSYGN